VAAVAQRAGLGVILEARDLAFGWSAASPLGRGLSFGVEAGEIVCILGPNGGGKTTLFRTLTGLLPALGGDVRLAGDALSALDRAAIARRVAVVPQSSQIVFPFAVEDLVLMGRTAHLPFLAMPGRADRAAARAALEELGIAHLATRSCNAISGGERQLVLFARALVQAPRAIVLDEPTASLDFGNQVKVLQTLRGLAARGLAVLVSTHDPDHAFLVADRALLLHGGAIVAAGAPREAITPATLRLLYGVEAEVATLPDGRAVCVPHVGGTRRPGPA
jgi:iron complex transport system ATP-binding protein